MSRARRRTAFRVLVASLVIGVATGLSGCVPDEQPAASTPAGEPTPAATSPVTPDDESALVAVPASCDQLVPDDVRTRLAQLSLNDPKAQTDGLRSGLANADLAKLAESKRELACVWRNTDSDTTFLRTTVVRINGGDGAAAVKLLTDDRIQCYPAHEGLRCEYTTDRKDPAIEFGETHYFRDDLWIATAWSNVAPPGYTAAIVDTLWSDED